MKIVFAKPETPTTGTYVVCVHEDRKLTAEAAALDKRMGGQIGAALGASRFKGRKGETLDILAPHGLSVRRVVLLGLGKPADLGALRHRGLTQLDLRNVQLPAGFASLQQLAREI